MASSKEINVLLVSLFYQGHINPMIQFARILTSKGLHVTIATTEHAREHMQNETTQPDFVDFEFFSDGLDVNLDRDKNLDILLEEYLPREGAKNLSNVISILENKGKRFSCIITNCFVPWVANVAETHNIPCAMLWIQSCATYGIYYHYFKTPSIFPSLNDPNNFIEIPGLPLLKVEDLPSFLFPSTPSHFLNVISTTIHSLDKFGWIFGSSFNDIEESLIYSMDKFKPILPIGPLVPPIMLEKVIDFHSEDEICMNWLNKQTPSSVMYIALGSISVLSQSETEAVAVALENVNNLKFLWVRKEGEKGWGRKMGDLPNEFLEKTKDRGLVVSWCCQEKVLIHPSINCFLTHCGWNSTLETITAGVPVIAYPDWTDQGTNSRLLVDVFKVGVRMRKNKDGELEKEEVERCIMEVTTGARALAMKKQAIKWKKAANNATMTDGSSDRIINNFICEIITSKTT